MTTLDVIESGEVTDLPDAQELLQIPNVANHDTIIPVDQTPSDINTSIDVGDVYVASPESEQANITSVTVLLGNPHDEDVIDKELLSGWFGWDRERGLKIRLFEDHEEVTLYKGIASIE